LGKRKGEIGKREEVSRLRSDELRRAKEERGQRREDIKRRTPRLNTLEGNPVQLGREDGRRETGDGGRMSEIRWGTGYRKGEIGKK